MISNSAIPVFCEIDELYAAAQFAPAPLSPDFDLIRLKRTRGRAEFASLVGPHRRGFFQFTYLRSTRRDLLLAAAPEQVLNDVRYLRTAADEQGHTLLFKAAAVADQLASPANEFPFFYLPASLELPVAERVRDRLLPQLQALEVAASTANPYRSQRLSALLTALLYDVRWIFEQAETAAGPHRLCSQLACRFDEVVLRHFHTHHTVGDYARLLHVSADHLSDEVKAKTGRNARDIIAERLITEARHLLAHTELTVSEVADRLGFSEPTHFTRYFKRHTHISPREFHRQALRPWIKQLPAAPTAIPRLAAAM